MSYHVYIARAGFKETPISMEDWLAAARNCDELVVERGKNRKSEHHLVWLRDRRRARSSRSPYGLVFAQDPDKALVAVMFRLAQLLDAGVYSETLERYASVEDWDQRTAEERLHRQQRRAGYKRRRRLRMALAVLFIALGAVIGLLASAGLKR